MMGRPANVALLCLLVLLLLGCGGDDDAGEAPGSAGATCVWDTSAWGNCRWDD